MKEIQCVFCVRWVGGGCIVIEILAHWWIDEGVGGGKFVRKY